MNPIKQRLQLTTDQATDYQSILGLAMTAAVAMDGPWQRWLIMATLLAMSFVAWLNRGHEAHKPGMPEPDIDENEALSDVVRRGRR